MKDVPQSAIDDFWLAYFAKYPGRGSSAEMNELRRHYKRIGRMNACNEIVRTKSNYAPPKAQTPRGHEAQRGYGAPRRKWDPKP